MQQRLDPITHRCAGRLQLCAHHADPPQRRLLRDRMPEGAVHGDDDAQVAGEQPDVVQCRSERQHAGRRVAPQRRLEPDHPAQGGGDAHRAAGVGPQRERHRPVGDRRRRAGARTAGDAGVGRVHRLPGGIGGVADRPEVMVHARPAEGELVQRGQPDRHRAERTQPLDDAGVHRLRRSGAGFVSSCCPGSTTAHPSSRAVERWTSGSSRSAEPAPIGCPRTAIRSLTANGTPARGGPPRVGADARSTSSARSRTNGPPCDTGRARKSRPPRGCRLVGVEGRRIDDVTAPPRHPRAARSAAGNGRVARPRPAVGARCRAARSPRTAAHSAGSSTRAPPCPWASAW